MTDLIACLGAGKGTWTGVFKLSARPEFQNTFLVVNDWTKNNLKMEQPNVHLIVVNSEVKSSIIRDQIVAQLKGKINDLEVAVNLDSGTGKEHMATVTALMRLGLSFRFVVWENEAIEEVSYDLEIPKEEEFY